MVVIAIAISLVLFSGNQGIAQVSVSMGPKAGLSFSGLRGQNAGEIVWRRGLCGGLFLNISPLQFLSIQPEILFQQRGAVNEIKESNLREDISIEYLSIPLLLKLRIPIFRTIYPHVYAGAQFSKNLKSEYSRSNIDGDAIDEEMNFNDFDFAGLFGAGMDIVVKHLFVTMDFRYGFGAMNLVQDENIDLRNKGKSILFGVGYKF